MNDDTQHTPLDSDGALQASDTRTLVHVTITIDDGNRKKTIEFDSKPENLECTWNSVPDPDWDIYLPDDPRYILSLRNMPRRVHMGLSAIAVSGEDGTYALVTMDPPPTQP